MKDIGKVIDVVKDVLTENPYTRGSDTNLYIEVCKKYNPDVACLGFVYVFNNRKELGIPCYESVRRSRQKLQHDNESLRPSESVTDARYEAYKAVMECI